MLKIGDNISEVLETKSRGILRCATATRSYWRREPKPVLSAVYFRFDGRSAWFAYRDTDLIATRHHARELPKKIRTATLKRWSA